MTKYVYGAVLRESEDGGWWAEVPDLPGCFGQGDSFMDAVASVSDGIETHLAALAEYDMPIPPAGPVKSADGEVVYVYADTDTVSLGEPCMSAAEAARALDVTPGRISQLLREGRLSGERTVDGTNVTVASVEAYQASRRGVGRPRKAAMA